MSMFIVIAVFVVAILVLSSIQQRRIMSRFWLRRCTGFIWRRRFPHASKNEIREFLDIFIDAFGFAQARRLCFAPEDRVMDVYRTLYSPGSLSDSMELEDFVRDLQRRYRVDILGSWR